MATLKSLGRVKDSFFISLEKLKPSDIQPRTIFELESIASLANSLVLEGQHTPAVVRLSPCGTMAIIIHGERRWRAAKYANKNLMSNIEGLACVSEKNTRGMTDDKRFVMQLTNNEEQVPLSVIERAKAYRKLSDKWGYSVIGVAKAVHRSEQHIRDMFKLLEAPEDIQEAVQSGAISATAATKTAKARKDVQDSVRDKLKSGDDVSIEDVQNRVDEGLLKPLSAKKINEIIKKAEKNILKSKGKERDKWMAVKYGLECAIGMHEIQ